MIKFINKTPFETSIAIHGTCRVISSNPTCTKDLSSAPPIWKWLIEWIYILYHGPLYKNVNFIIEPWSDYEINLYSSEDSSITMGFNDVCTPWKKHAPGIYQWNTKEMELTIKCNPGHPKLSRRGRGPLIAGDIPLHIVTESNNGSWKVSQEPITMLQYSPTFNNAYYKEPR